MKNLFKKIGALLVAAVMVLSMCTAAFASAGADKIIGTSDDVDTISVEGVTVEKGVTVTAYPIVLATYDDNRNFSGYSVVNGYTINKINDPTQAELANIADIIKGGYAGITNANTNSYPLTANNGVYTATVPVGMYLVLVEGSETVSYNPAVVSVRYSSNGQENTIEAGKVDFEADATMGGVTVAKKSGEPNVDKIITNPTEKDKDGNANGTSVNIGDTVKYQVTVNPIPDYRGNHPVLNVVDTLSAGLTFKDNSLKVKVDGSELIAGTDYTFVKRGNEITVNFVVDGKYTLNSYAGKVAVITYEATLNEKAAINNSGNTNDVKLNYTKDSKVDGQDGEKTDKTYTYTFDIDGSVTGGILTKKATDTNAALAGAKFTVYKDLDCTQKYTNTYKESDDAQAKTFDGTVTSDNKGQLHITGLAAGTYYLKETKAPDGYTLNTHVFTVVIKASYNNDGILKSWTVTIDGAATSTFTVENGVLKDPAINSTDIMNTKLSSLPSTGGMGTYLFTIIGVVVMAGAAGAFFISRRKGSEE